MNLNILGGNTALTFVSDISSAGLYQCASSQNGLALEGNLYTSEEDSLYIFSACE